MVNERQIAQIMKVIGDHEKRLRKLEGASQKGGANQVSANRESILGRLAGLKCDKFFDQPKKIGEIKEELARRGYHYETSSLTEPLQRAIRSGLLGRIKKDKRWAYCKR